MINSKLFYKGAAQSIRLSHIIQTSSRTPLARSINTAPLLRQPNRLYIKPATASCCVSNNEANPILAPYIRKTLSCSVCRQQFAAGVNLYGKPLTASSYHRHHNVSSYHSSTAVASTSDGGNNGGTNQPSDDSGRNGPNDNSEYTLGVASALNLASSEEVILLDVTGMRCAGCVSRVKAILEEQPPVKAASVNLATETAVVRVNVPSKDAPLPVITPVSTSSIDSDDMLDEESGIPIQEQRLMTMGVNLAKLLTDKGYAATLRPRGGGTSASAKVVAAKRQERMARLKDATRRLAVAWLLASGCLAHHLVHWLGLGAPAWLHGLIGNTAVHAALSALAILGPGRHIVSDGFSALSRNAPDMNSLVALGATAAYSISAIAAFLPKLGWPTFFEEPAMLLGVVLIGRALEERAKLQASADMAALQGLLPQKARLLLSDSVTWREVPAETVTVGDCVEVLPGDRVPVDGVVVGGKSSVDESGMTGEPLPVNKSEGDHVAAGSLNYDGRLTVKAVASGGDTAVADIVRLVESAQGRNAPIQRIADEVAGKFTYGVMGAAAAAFAFWIGPGTHFFPKVLAPFASTTSTAAASLLLSLQMACNVLVVACPCALGLAAPTAVLVGTSAGARRGLLVRGGDVLESASQVDTVVFDKTGTLTMGRPTVVATHLLVPSTSNKMSSTTSYISEERVLELAGAVEKSSTHPIGKAISRAAEKISSTNKTLLPVEEGTFVQEPGSGVSGVVDGHAVFVGSWEWVSQKVAEQQIIHSISSNGNGNGTGLSSTSLDNTNNNNTSTNSAKPGHILVHVGIDTSLIGTIEISDELRPDAAATVAALKKAGIRSVMLSGDQPATANAIAAAVGIDSGSVLAGVKPAGKAAAVEKLQAQGKKVAMVGDGVNDAAALAAANVGMAMGGGVDAASEVADIVLLGDKVPQVLDALKLSRATLATIKQNMWWAFAYNLACIPVAAGALLPGYGIVLTPSISGAMMGVSSLAVMANSLLLQHRIDSGQLQTTGGGNSKTNASGKNEKNKGDEDRVRSSKPLAV